MGTRCRSNLIIRSLCGRVCVRAGVALSVGYDLNSLQAWGSLWDEHL